MPGPGKYEIKSQFSAKPPPVNQEEPIIHPPFGTQSRVRHTTCNALRTCIYITCQVQLTEHKQTVLDYNPVLRNECH